MSDQSVAIVVRRVEQADHALVLALLKPYVDQKKLLRRTIDELDVLLTNGFVASCDGQIAGFASLEVYSRKLAEVRALVVADDQQKKGIGKLLVEACIQRARELDIMEVMAISSAESFFMSCGFGFTLPDEKKAFFLQTGLRQ